MDEIVAITVSINYADYLEDTLPHNRYLFKDFWIVTEETDTKTIELATKYKCQIHFTTKTHENGAKFNFAGIRREIQQIVHTKYPDKWICLLDADAYISNSFSCLDITKLNKENVYGCQRKIYAYREQFLHDLLNKENQLLYKNEVVKISPVVFRGPIPQRRPNIEFRSNISRPTPVSRPEPKVYTYGYFQLYFNKLKLYENYSKSCEKCDVNFANLFKEQVMLPNISVFHLGPNGINWNGRVSAEWK